MNGVPGGRGDEIRPCMPHSFQRFQRTSRLTLQRLLHARVHACGTPRRASRVGSFAMARLVVSAVPVSRKLLHCHSNCGGRQWKICSDPGRTGEG